VRVTSVIAYKWPAACPGGEQRDRGIASPSSAASGDHPSRVSWHNVLTLNLVAGTRKSGNSEKHQHSANHQTQWPHRGGTQYRWRRVG